MYQSGRLNPRMRAFVVAEADRIGVAQAARNIGVSRNTVYRWRRRGGELEDRPCRPHHSPRRTSPEREAALLAARLEWRWGPDRIGPLTGIPPDGVPDPAAVSDASTARAVPGGATNPRHVHRERAR